MEPPRSAAMERGADQRGNKQGASSCGTVRNRAAGGEPAKTPYPSRAERCDAVWNTRRRSSHARGRRFETRRAHHPKDRALQGFYLEAAAPQRVQSRREQAGTSKIGALRNFVEPYGAARTARTADEREAANDRSQRNKQLATEWA
jgi:hypothetical protein